MKHTETYQFNLIEGSDDFSPLPINENTRAMEAALMSGAKVAVGTYVGNGEVGSGDANSLTFDFTPKFLYIWGRDAYNIFAMATQGVELRCYTQQSSGYAVLNTTWGKNSVTWYYDDTDHGYAYVQLNSSGLTYQYLALG